MDALVTLMTAAALSTAGASPANPSREAIEGFFAAKGDAPEIDEKANSVEICYDSTCAYYRLGVGLARPQAWDALFLHQYYYIGTNVYLAEFKEKNADLAHSLMAKYGRLCPRAEEAAKPGCVIGYLGVRNRIRYGFVRYDDGNRCIVWVHLVHSKTMYGGGCRKVEHAS